MEDSYEKQVEESVFNDKSLSLMFGLVKEYLDDSDARYFLDRMILLKAFREEKISHDKYEELIQRNLRLSKRGIKFGTSFYSLSTLYEQYHFDMEDAMWPKKFALRDEFYKNGNIKIRYMREVKRPDMGELK